MTSQGWQPGDYLGAKNAAHAEFHTVANASHIRVSIKDDNLGLGAKIGSGVGHGECTGLDAFTNLLGRLNGKDEEELEREQKSREDLKRAIYTERRWGSIRFVPGGFLIGDKIQHLIDGEAERIRKLAEGKSDDSSDTSSSSESEEETPVVVEKPKKSKKRKIEALEAEPEVVAIKVKKSKKKRKSEATPKDAEEVTAALEEVKISRKKPKKERKSKREPEESEDDTEIKKRKKDKKSKKDRRENKDKTVSDVDTTEKESKKKKSKRDKEDRFEKDPDSMETSQASTKESRPSTPLTVESSGRSTPMMQGRHAVRARNIAQKRLAHMDVASLNQVNVLSSQPNLSQTNLIQIFMIKSQS
jgi:Pin2-interacting protein X1